MSTGLSSGDRKTSKGQRCLAQVMISHIGANNGTAMEQSNGFPRGWFVTVGLTALARKLSDSDITFTGW